MYLKSSKKPVEIHNYHPKLNRVLPTWSKNNSSKKRIFVISAIFKSSIESDFTFLLKITSSERFSRVINEMFVFNNFFSFALFVWITNQLWGFKCCTVFERGLYLKFRSSWSGECGKVSRINRIFRDWRVF